MAEATDFINEGGHWFVKLSYDIRLKSCSREIWLSLIDEGFESELKIDNYIDYYMEFFRQKINHDGHDFNQLKEDVRKYIKNKYEKNKIAQCSVCGEIGNGHRFWGRTEHNWKHKICKKCHLESTKCSCCGSMKMRKVYPFIEEEGRYSDVCTVCTNKAKKKSNKNMTALELENYAYKTFNEETYVPIKMPIEKISLEQIHLKKEMLEKNRRLQQCSECGEVGYSSVLFGRTPRNKKYKLCLKCTAKFVECSCCGRLKVRKSYPFIEEEGRYSDVCTVCTNKTKQHIKNHENMSSLELEDAVYTFLTE